MTQHLHFHLTLLFLSILLGADCARSNDKPTITWLNIDWQPAWIFEGEWKGKGYAQTTEQLLQAHLSGYRHVQQTVINVRTYTIIKNMEACFAVAPYQGSDLNPQQRDGLVFSAPTFLFLYHGVIAREDAHDTITRFQTGSLVNFQKLIADKKLTGAFQPGRVYSRWLNDIFVSDPNVKNMFRWSGQAHLTQSMFKMMDAGRFDYFVDYYLMLRFHELTQGNPSYYRYYPLLEHKGQFGMGGIACHDTPLGRKVIDEINAALKDIRHLPEFRNANAFWLMPTGQESLYWQLWQDELLARED